MPLEAQEAWVKYIKSLEDTSVKLSELISLGYSYPEAKEIFTEAIESGKAVDIDKLKAKSSS